MSSIRHRRLQSDYRSVIENFKEHPYINVKVLDGDPPEKYQIYYNIRGIKLEKGENIPSVITEHIVEIYLHSDYPRKPPQCTIHTPIFHPNISPSRICIADEDNWAPDEDLSTLIFRIGRIIQYQDYNLENPRNETAANWVRRNNYIFPIDNISLPDPYVCFKVQETDIILPPVLPEDEGIVLL